jgi:type I site-specific restriction endonuclease
VFGYPSFQHSDSYFFRAADRQLQKGKSRGKGPRYYQKITRQWVVEAAAAGRKRPLPTLAKGTDKTVAALPGLLKSLIG